MPGPHKEWNCRRNFVSVITDETIDISSDSQLVLVLRHVLSNGQPVERFLEFVKEVNSLTFSGKSCGHS